MTANEMADLLIIIDALQGNVALTEAATMLRQQQVEIEALKEHIANLVDDLFAERKEVLKFEAEIEQLKALAISLSPNANLIYTKASEK